MATIPTDRIFALNTKTKGGPPTLNLPLATSGQPAAGAAGTAPGSLVTLASNVATITNNAVDTDTTTVIGLTEWRYDKGATPAANTFTEVTVCGPFWEYEGTAVGSGIVMGTAYTLANVTSANYASLTSTTTKGAARVLYFPGLVDAFRMNDYLAEAGTSLVAGSLSQPHASVKGTPSDTNPRVVFTFLPAVTIYGH
jgi:hypothetical protein